MAAYSPQRIGILGGTFDPPHIGHLILAETAFDVLSLSCVLLVPAADPPHKHTLAITPIQHRLAMLTQAVADNPRFVLSDIDIARPGPHYTVDTLRLLQQQYPDAELYFLLGGDSLRDMPTWYDPAGIIAQAKVAVMGRPGATLDLPTLEADLPGITTRLMFVESPLIDISATLLRERLRKGHSIRYLVPEVVERYIVENALYRDNNHA
ncbi:MAG: nicotinate-nucleotide adenylyltransferase [Chloroflexota bacterium]